MRSSITPDRIERYRYEPDTVVREILDEWDAEYREIKGANPEINVWDVCQHILSNESS